jgi:mycofactocin system glycosyltransferase
VTVPLPNGFRIELDTATRHLTEHLWFGGSPPRVLRLTPAGHAAWQALRDGPVRSAATGMLARRLVDAGLAHPRPAEPGGTPEVTVVIPVRDRADMLDRCLSSVDGPYPVLVVDDGSRDARAVAKVVARHGATLLRRTRNGGPGVARNTALERVRTDLVAFLDSDCVPPPGWIDRLAPHFADPLVAAVAPRITGFAHEDGSAAEPAESGLDLGDQPARVVPNTRLSYVPTAALLARSDALRAVAREDAVFDPALRVGEDVDLVWRLHEAGWRIRYEPSVRVAHHEPVTLPALLGRRFRYGTSAAPLALRHPRSVPPLVLHPWPALTVAALLGRRPAAAGVAFAVAVLSMVRTLRRAGVPTRGVLRAMLTAVHQTWLGIGHYGVQFGAPALLAALVAPGGARRRTRWGRRLAVGSLLLGPALTAWVGRRGPDRSRPDPVRFVARHLADDIAYGAGVWAGCARHGTGIPVRPVVSWRPLRIDGADHQPRPRPAGS